MGDGKVRDSHADLEGEIRDWGDFPDPGEEINCRCWAEPVEEKKMKSCGELSIQLQNRILQRKNESESALKADKRAKELRKEQDIAWEKVKEEIRQAGFDISASFVPGLDGRIPIIGQILEVAKNAAEIWVAYQKYLQLWGKLQEAVDEQKWFEKQAKETQEEIKEIRDQVKNQDCDQGKQL